ncbi:MAG TPA: serine protease, partial [Kiritimatiellia bacterium]
MRSALLLAVVGTAAFALPCVALDVVREWSEVRDGQTLVGRQVIDRVTGAQRTEYYDAAGKPVSDAFTKSNQRTWGQAPESAPREIAPDRPRRPRSVPATIRERIAAYSEMVALATPDLRPILDQDRRDTSDAKGPMRIGFFRDLPRRISVSPAQRGRWFNLPDGSQVWSLVLESPGAEGIRLRLANLNVPPGVQFMVFDATQPTMTYEYHTSTDSSGTTTFWTETTFSSKVALEFVVPPGVDASQLRFDIDRIVHVYVKLGDWGMPKEGNCHNDVTCYPAYTTQAAGVAGIGSIGEGGFLFCTGCLLADGDPATVVNYFMTANHCVANSSEASTLEFYWFFQTSSCNGSPPDPEDVPRTTGGADYLAGATRDAGSDFAFLRMKQSPPGGVAYEGWSTAQLAANEAIAGIHHPDGTFKRISFGNFVKYAGNFTDVRWSSGVTEPGSSGSPLFNNAKLFVGQLYGGQSYCWRQNGIDEYGRFDITFPIIKQYLSVNPPARMLYYDDPRDFDGDGMADLAIYHPP